MSMDPASPSRRRFMAMAPALGAIPLLGLPAARALAAADEAALLAGARQEGRGVIYGNAEPAALDQVLKVFTAKYGLKVDVQRLTTAALAQRFTAEINANIHQADLFISSDPVFIRDAVKKGWLLRPDDLPEMAHWPKSDTVDGLVSIGLNPYVLAWNSDVVRVAPQGWEALNDPQWRGKVLIGDPRVLAVVRLWFVAIRNRYGDEFVRTLGSHATFSPSAVPGIQQLAAGAVALYAPATFLNSQDLMHKGAPIKFLLTEPVVVSVPWGAVVAQAPHPNFGRLLLNFMMTPEAQAAFNKDGVSLLPNIPGTTQVSNVTTIDPSEGERQLPELLSLLKLG